MTVGERIQDLRKKKGYSQEKLANHLNMSRQAIAKWEQNVCEPGIESLVAMAELFEVNLDYLITGKPKKSDVSQIVVTKDPLLDKKDILLLIALITSIAVFIGLFIYALLNPLYWKQTYSFIWWYVRLGVSSGIWFRILTLLSAAGIVLSLVFFVRKRR